MKEKLIFVGFCITFLIYMLFMILSTPLVWLGSVFEGAAEWLDEKAYNIKLKRDEGASQRSN
jgi:hypothetical protein